MERLRSKLKLQIRQTNYLRLKLGKCWLCHELWLLVWLVVTVVWDCGSVTGQQ